MTGDPTRDNKADSHHFGGPDVPLEDEYAQHAREEREAEQRERMDAPHEKAKAERDDCADCGHQHTGVEWGYICIGCPCERRAEGRKEGEDG